MRTIGTLSNENFAHRLTNYLSYQGIKSKCDMQFDAATGSMTYQFWVQDEDAIAKAEMIFAEFVKNPLSPKYDAPEPQEPELPIPKVENDAPHRFRTHITYVFLYLCTLIFFISSLQEVSLEKLGLTEKTFLLTPIQAGLMFDLPPAVAELEKVIEKYELTGKPVEEIPPEIMAQLQRADKAPYWHGIYDWIVYKIQGKAPTQIIGPLFWRIRQGEVWRLFTPCLLHHDIFHILFNMIWLWYLGRPIEQRIGLWRTLVLTLVTGIGSNIFQYLMSGPFFIGYSGIVAALAGFTWMREKVAPWEGYPLNRTTILFLFFFIAAIFVLQIVSFFIQVFTAGQFSPQIANTAHITGAIIGALIARYSFFAQRVAQ